MPYIRVTLVDNVFSAEEKHEMAKALTDVMVRFEGSEARIKRLCQRPACPGHCHLR